MRRLRKAKAPRHDYADEPRRDCHPDPTDSTCYLHLDGSPQHIRQNPPAWLHVIEKSTEFRAELLAPASRIQHGHEFNPAPHTGFNLRRAVFTTLSSSVICS